MAKILACVDGSVYAASVCDHAAWTARRLGATVEALHVVEPHRERAAMADFSGAIGVDANDELLRQLAELDEARGRLALRKAKLVLGEAERRLKDAGVADIVQTQRHGALVETLDELEDAAELLIVGKRGEEADFAALHLGSNLERAARVARRPLLAAARAFRPIERFLIAFDGGPGAQQAVAYAAQKPLLKGLSCDLLTVGRPNDDARAKLDAAAETLSRAGYDVRAAIEPGLPEDAIAAYVAARGVDLLAMGAYGHSRIRSLVLGSTTAQMIRGCQIPVLMFRVNAGASNGAN